MKKNVSRIAGCTAASVLGLVAGGTSLAHAAPAPDNGFGTAVIADYDGDGIDDLASFTADNRFHIDYARNGFGSWDTQPYLGLVKVGVTYQPVPADYNGDGLADLAVMSSEGFWFIDLARRNEGFANG